MRALIQRVTQASVTIDGAVHSTIGTGFLVLLGICDSDTTRECEYLADKCLQTRIFTDENDKMNLSLQDVQGSLLIVSQFTLYADCRKGRRPNFTKAAGAQVANALYEQFVARCRESGIAVQTGVFGADMQVQLCNDGPVTILMDTAEML